jgi:hypothetical protein
MRQRHVPRLCQCCRGPMARQAETCWRCGTQWASEDETRTLLRVIPGGVPAAAGSQRAVSAGRIHMDRWAGEGGSLVSEARATINRRSKQCAS